MTMPTTALKRDPIQDTHSQTVSYHKRLRVALAKLEVIWEQSEAAAIDLPREDYAEILEEIERCASGLGTEMNLLRLQRKQSAAAK